MKKKKIKNIVFKPLKSHNIEEIFFLWISIYNITNTKRVTIEGGGSNVSYDNDFFFLWITVIFGFDRNIITFSTEFEVSPTDGSIHETIFPNSTYQDLQVGDKENSGFIKPIVHR